MSDQLLRRAQIAVRQRVDDLDFNRTNQFALSNLALALRALMAPGLGVVRGLAVTPTYPTPSMQLTLEPGAALAPGPGGVGTGLIVVESARTLSVAANTSGHPRIDLVSIRYDEQPGAAETRKFRANDAWFDQPGTFTEVIANPVVTVTQGTPADTPAAPDTPAGDLALCTVTVASGATYLNAQSLTRVNTDRSSPLIVGSAGGHVGIALPWNPGPLVELATPQGATTFFVGKLDMNSGFMNTGTALWLSIKDVAGGWSVGQSYFFSPKWQVDQEGAPAAVFTTFYVVGTVWGPTGAYPNAVGDPVRQYTIELARQSGWQPPFTGVTVQAPLLAAWTL